MLLANQPEKPALRLSFYLRPKYLTQFMEPLYTDNQVTLGTLEMPLVLPLHTNSFQPIKWLYATRLEMIKLVIPKTLMLLLNVSCLVGTDYDHNSDAMNSLIKH